MPPAPSTSGRSATPGSTDVAAAAADDAVDYQRLVRTNIARRHAQARCDAAILARDAASSGRVRAADQIASLIRRAAEGEAITEGTITDAFHASRAAADVASFCGSVVGELRLMLDQAQAAYAAAEADAEAIRNPPTVADARAA